MDLGRAADREALREHLSATYRGRPVLVGPGVLAGFASAVAMLQEAGATRVLVLATGRGAGPVPDVPVIGLTAPGGANVSEELREHDRLLHDLPDDVVAQVEAWDPERAAVWCTTHFVADDEPVLGRLVTNGRPRAWLALEDKLYAEELWAATDVPHSPSLVVDATPEALAEASAALGGNVVWAGDNREGFHGSGDFVRWVPEQAVQAEVAPYFAAHCDRVRVMPFLEGVPCSIHGMVLPDGTAAFRPVEIAILRQGHRFVYGGVATYWDPPATDREAMRDVVRRVGEHLRAAHGYRGAFGIDGVLTADGFRPTELNTRMPAGLAHAGGSVDRTLFTLLQTVLVLGQDPGIDVAGLETAVTVMDRVRTGRPVALGPGAVGTDSYPVAWDGTTLRRSAEETGSTLVLGETPSGFFSKVDPCKALRPGDRLAPLNAALMGLLDREHGTAFGPVEVAPDVRGATVA